MAELNKFLAFNTFLLDAGKIERQTLVPGTDRKENDMEHSFQLAMLAWYLIDAEHLSLDVSLVLQYALVHDLVEVYAGDTPLWGSDDKKATKHDREQDALSRIKNNFPLFPNLSSVLEQYENQKDEESRFVYALDKLLPVLNTYTDNGRRWKELGITLSMVMEAKVEKVSCDGTVRTYFHLLAKTLEERQDELFCNHPNP